MVTVRFAALVSLDAAVLVFATPDVPGLAHGLAHPRTWLATAGADRVATTAVGALLWLLAAWVAVGLIAAVAAGLPGLPGAVGRVADSVAAVALPAALRRVVAGSVGLGVLLTPVVAGARSPEQPPIAAAAQVAMDGSAAGVAAGAVIPPAPVPGPAWPSSAGHHASAGAVTVRPGQCLWSIAEHHVHTTDPRSVAPFVQRLYAANRAVVGADPDHVVPGQVLHLPADPEGNR